MVVFRRATCHQMRCQPRGEGTGKGRGDGSVSEGRLGRGRCTRTSLGAVQTVRGWLSDLGMSPAQLERRDRKKEERERATSQAGARLKESARVRERETRLGHYSATFLPL